MTTDVIEFFVHFHGAFRIGTGRAGLSADETVNADNPLPASSLKGVMRAAAFSLLRLNDFLIDEVFGSARAGSPWSWSDAQPAHGWPAAVTRTRVAIDPETGASRTDMLVVAEELRPTAPARFTIRRTGQIDDRIGLHRDVLVAAAAAVHTLGADRRRGLGWVNVTCPDHSARVAASLDSLAAHQVSRA